MSDHNFDIYCLKQWLAGLQKPNEEEVIKALMAIKDKRIRTIVIEHCYNKRTFTDLGKEYNISRQRIQQLFKKGINLIKKELGV